jgi:SPP1 family predicted phage head-tail adaptor
MRGGVLKNVITIEESYTSSTGRANETIVSWRKWRDTFAEITSVRGKEFFEKGQRYSETVFRFRCRYFDVVGLSHAMRISFEGQTYNIKSIQADLQRRNDTIIDATLIQ